MKFVQRLVKISEAKELIEKAVERVKAGENRLKESLAKNIETVKLYKGQNDVTPETLIPMIIEEEETPAEANATILKELAEIKKSVGELKPSIESLKKETTATNTLALVNETIDGMVAGLISLKDRANAGTGVTADELTAVWPGYETRELISGLLATLNNMQKAVEIFGEVKPSLDSVMKEDGEGESEGGEASGEGQGGGDQGGEDGEGGEVKPDDKPDDKPSDGEDGGDGESGETESGEGGDRGKTGDDNPDDSSATDDSISDMDLSPPLDNEAPKSENEPVIED